jgi:hypothetical protein
MNLGPMSWSQFSAIFDNFQRKNWRFFLKNQCYDNFFSKITFYFSQKHPLFRQIFLWFFKTITSVPDRMIYFRKTLFLDGSFKFGAFQKTLIISKTFWDLGRKGKSWVWCRAKILPRTHLKSALVITHSWKWWSRFRLEKKFRRKSIFIWQT